MEKKQLYLYEGEVVSEEEYIQKIGFAGYEDLYEKLIDPNREKENIEYMYLIQLFDYNCPNCVSGVTKVFVEDIEEFTRLYCSIENDEYRVQRFLRSKGGEVITDYYSDDHSLNIVQKFKVNILGRTKSWGSYKVVSVENGYGWPSDYSFRLLVLDMRWIEVQGKYYKLVRPYGRDCHKTYDCDGQSQKEDIHVYGNPFWIVDGASLESYVWQVAEIFDSEEAMKEDRRKLTERSLTEQQINRVFADIPGDAG